MAGGYLPTVFPTSSGARISPIVRLHENCTAVHFRTHTCMYVCMNVYAAYMSDVYPKTEREVSDKDLSVLVSLTLSPFDNASVVYFSFSAL